MIRWKRRQLITRLGATAGLLPFIPLLNAEADAQQGAFPRRLIVWFYPNGTLPDAYFPQGDALEATPILEPMKRHFEDCIVLNGVDLKPVEAGIKIVHISYVAALLTGHTILDGDQENQGISYGWAAGPSIDQFLAERIGSESLFPSLEFHNVGMKDEFMTQYRMIYRAANQPVTGMRHPLDAFERIFGNGVSPDTVLRANEQSVLDKLKTDLEQFKAKLPAAEWPKLEAHLESVRKVEKRLLGAPLECSPQRPTALDGIAGFEDGTCGAQDNEPGVCVWDQHYEEVLNSQVDVLVQALACGATTIASIQNGSGGRGHYFVGWDDQGGDEHIMSHNQPERYADVKAWYMERLAYLVDKLKEVPEGNGTLFDNTLILVCSEHGVGAQHSSTNVPFMLVGGKWAFKTGRYLRFDAVPHNNLLLSVCHAFGLTDLTSFGDPAFTSGPLSELNT